MNTHWCRMLFVQRLSVCLLVLNYSRVASAPPVKSAVKESRLRPTAKWDMAKLDDFDLLNCTVHIDNNEPNWLRLVSASPSPSDLVFDSRALFMEVNRTYSAIDPSVQSLFEESVYIRKPREDAKTTSGHGSEWNKDKRSLYGYKYSSVGDQIQIGRLRTMVYELSSEKMGIPLSSGGMTWHVSKITLTLTSGLSGRKVKGFLTTVNTLKPSTHSKRDCILIYSGTNGWCPVCTPTANASIPIFRNFTMLFKSDHGIHVSENENGLDRNTLVLLAMLAVVWGDLFTRRSAGSMRPKFRHCLRTVSRDLSRATWKERPFVAISSLARNLISTEVSEFLFKDETYDNDETLKPPAPKKCLTNQVQVAAFHTNLRVAPVTFLPSSFTPDVSRFDHVGCRLASLATLPPACPLSRVKLAEAGFHYDPRSSKDAVVCHKCWATLPLDPSVHSGSPLQLHHRASPNCEFLKGVMDTLMIDPASLSSSTSASSKLSQQSSGHGSMAPCALSMSSLPCTVDSSSAPFSMMSTDSSKTSSSLGAVCSSLSTASFLSDSSGSTAASSGFSSLPAMPAASCGLAAATAGGKPLQVDGRDSTDSKRDLSIDGLEEVPDSRMQISRPSTLSTDFTEAAGSNGYFLALPTTSADVSSHPTSPQADFSSPGNIFFQTLTTPSATSSGSNPFSDSATRLTLDLSSAVYPQFGTTQARLATFQNWPHMRVFPPAMMVSVGFYYAGYADCARCFYCGVGLKTWDENDDVLVEHIRWRPTCAFLLATKGKQFIDDVLAKANAENGTRQSNNQAQQRASPPRTANQPPRTESNLPSRQIQAPPQGRTGDVRPGDGEAEMLNQLRNMGFSPDAISNARAQIMNWGQQPDLQRMLDLLLG